METNKELAPVTPRFINRGTVWLIPAVTAISLLLGHPIITWLLAAATLLQFAILYLSRRPPMQSSSRLTEVGPANEPGSNQLREKTQALKRALLKSQFEASTEKLASRALEQLQQNTERLKSFERTLSLKLDLNELTYQRYHSVAQEVHLAILDHLNEVATYLATASAMKPEETETRLRELSKIASQEVPTSESDLTGELTTLKARVSVFSKELSSAEALLVANETAITRLDQLTSAVSEMKNLTQSTTGDMGSLLIELEELAARAKKYPGAQS